MSARVSRDFRFQAGMHYDDSFIINFYEFTLFIEVITEDVREQNVALDRIKYLLDGCFENCVFVSATNKIAIEGYARAGMRICTLPEDPYDQIVAAVILSKLNRITEGKVYISEIRLKSRICDEVMFYISNQEDSEFTTVIGAWWTDPTTAIADTPKKVNKKDKVVELKRDNPDWSELGLSWKEPEVESKSNEIVFHTEKT